MKSGGGLVIGLSFVFSFLILALVANLYYFLCWKKKKRIINIRRIEEEEDLENGKDYYAAVTGKYAKELFHLVCWKNPPTTARPDAEYGAAAGRAEESVEVELMRLHNLAGPPRFLFTIKEETKEDLVESEDGRSRRISLSRSKSVTEILATAPFTPMESPRYSLQGFNPLFESAAEAELNRLMSSPPPKFKFMRDAEEKLLRRLMKESAENNNSGGLDCLAKYLAPAAEEEVREGSFLGFLYGKNREAAAGNHRLPISSQTVLICGDKPSTQVHPRGLRQARD